MSADAYREYLTFNSALATEKIREMAEAYYTRLELGLLKVIAGLLGVPLSQLTERDAAHRAALAEKEAQRQREIAERERINSERLKHRNRILTAAALVVLVLGMGAVIDYKRAEQGERNSKTAEAQARSLNEEAARSDRFVAEEKLSAGDGPAALAHLARAINYAPVSTLAAEKAVAALNIWKHPPPLAALSGHEDAVNDAQFSPNGARIVTASTNETARVWTILPPSAGPPPEWFRDFLHYMGRKRLNTDGELVNIPTADWLALRENLRAVLRADAGKKTTYLEVLRHFVKE